MFASDELFGEWVAHSQLDSADYMERAAAMWAAAQPQANPEFAGLI